MKSNGRKIVIVGGGVAGLCAAVYALKCGYEVEVVEMQIIAGGLAMSWRRGAYTFETCLHWLLGSKPNGEFHDDWRDVCDIEKLTFVDSEEFVRIVDASGDKLSIYTNVDRLEEELFRRGREDSAAIHDLTHAIRILGRFRMLDPSGGIGGNWFNMLCDLPVFPVLNRLTKISGAEYSRRFRDPLLKSFFSNGDIGKMSAVAMVLSLAWMNAGNAGYCIGGAQALIRLIEEKIAGLGGRIRIGTKVEQILVEDNTAVGVLLEGGETIKADWVISAADGHATIFNLLSGRYVDPTIRQRYDEHELFASYLQVSLGIGLDLSYMPPMVSYLLSAPISVGAGTELNSVNFRFFHFDPTFSPPGKTAVTCLLPTRNFEYWANLRREDLGGYQAAKLQVAHAVIGVLEEHVSGIGKAIEVMDVSTPATVYRYTGNWKGTMEGWLVVPGESFKPLPNTLPGLKRFMMAGQWVMPGGGLPSGPMTARPAIKAICREDHVPFDVHVERSYQSEPVAAR